MCMYMYMALQCEYIVHVYTVSSLWLFRIHCSIEYVPLVKCAITEYIHVVYVYIVSTMSMAL